MLDRIENAFRSLILVLQIAKLYSTEHRKFREYLDKAFESFQDALKDKDELVIGIVGEEMAFEKEILFDLSRSVKSMILYLKARGIEKITFYRPLSKEELSKFIAFLIAPKEELKKDHQENLVALGIRNINVGKIKISDSIDPSQVESLAQAVDYLSLYNSSLDNVSQSLESMMNAQDIDYLNLRFGITSVLETMLMRYQEFLKLTVVKRYDINTFVHILNVSILSMHFASRMGLVKDDILDIGIAALFHDIGKMYISRSIIKKSARLTDDEFAKIEGHTVFGATILLRYTDTLGILPVVVAFEHHLRADLKGYPKLAFAQKPHLASAIVAVCDVYDALLGRRSYKASYPVNVIYELMLKEKEKFFYPRLLDKFFKIMGVWPIGTIVRLSDSRVAVVREANEDDIFAPKVEVVFPQDKKEFIDLKEKKGQLQIEKSLDPLGEGKEYVTLI
jgi:putative nucleotidyltransferase with HDIG domain